MTEPEQAQTILDELDARAAQSGENIAVSDGVLTLTWGELRRRARAFGAALARVYPAGQPLAVLAARRSETLILFYGALYAGCFYLPLDPDAPPRRLALILADAGAGAAAGCGSRPSFLPETVRWLACPAAAPAVLGEEEVFALAERRRGVTSSSPLCLIYTSGSTGTPKGVLKQQGAMRSFVSAFLAQYPLEPSDVIGSQTPFFFDASAKDIYWCLRAGCRLEILPARLFSFPVELVRTMNERRVSVISWVPSALSLVSQLGTFESILPETLRAVFFVGEVFPKKQLDRWRAALPQLLYVNLYGSTEIAGVCCHYRVTGAEPAGDALPIGRAFPHCGVFLEDKAGTRITAPGEEGEVCVTGPALATGYFHDDARTAAAFRTETGTDGPQRVLHTGDMAQYDGAGELVFTSRRDHQIKHMGYRIELGEIEAAVNALEPVGQCACIYDSAHGRIVLFVQPAPGEEALTAAALLPLLRRSLCSYMVPARVYILPALPHNASGKLDRPALAAGYAGGVYHN